ncbi:MAG: hypothetical protein R3B40_13130 [Polyangiales bacterium]|nr:hypothetical protein [Myxococcales bacterium]MCB9659952.1 hypothetical protein [Sandaracinaceae bacterium]
MFVVTRGSAQARSMLLVSLAVALTGVGCRSRGAPADDEAGHGGETVDAPHDDDRGQGDAAEPPSPADPATTGEPATVAGDQPGTDDAAAATHEPGAAVGTDDPTLATGEPDAAARTAGAGSTPEGDAPRRAVLPASSAALDPAVVAAIRRVLAPIRGCYQRELARNPAFQGGDPPPTVRPIEGRDGTVRMTLVGTSGSARVDRCLRNAARRMSFTRDDRPAHVQYPFLFTPDGESRDLPADG